MFIGCCMVAPAWLSRVRQEICLRPARKEGSVQVQDIASALQIQRGPHTQPHLRRQERSIGKNGKSEFIVTTPASISFSVIISSLVSLPSLPYCGAPRHSFRRLTLQSGGTRHPSVAKPAHSQTLATGCWTSYHIEATKIRRNF